MLAWIKRRLKQRFPNAFQRLHTTQTRWANRLRTEYRVIRQIVRGRLQGENVFVPWNQALPMQACRRVNVPDLDLTSLDALAGVSRNQNVLYLPPQTLQSSPLRHLANGYPVNAGLKILKESQPASSTSNFAQNQGPQRYIPLLANLFHREQFGPQLYDVLEIHRENTIWKACVIEHVDGRQPRAEEQQQGLARLRELEQARWIKIRQPAKGSQPGAHPACDLLTASSGKTCCLNFQDFDLVDYEPYLVKIATEAIKNTEFGEQSLLRRQYLYQSVPGVPIPAKRSCAYRMERLDQMIATCGFSVRDRLVLDIGCNVGVMMAEYLKRGARWCHGWDTTRAVPHTEAILRAIGCTRFSVTGTFIDAARLIEDDLPEFTTELLNGCVFSYLAIHHHVKWLEALGRIPWSFMVYEGHQYETKDMLQQFLVDLRQIVDVDLAECGSYADGHSNERLCAILVNKSARTVPG